MLYSNYVQTPGQELRLVARVISALAGPVVSLIQGVVFAVVVAKNKSNSMYHLLFLWLSLLGFINFFGYLMMTPLSTVGDTGKVAELLQISMANRILLAVGGFILVIMIILKTGRHFANFIPAETGMRERQRYVYSVMFFPIIIGSLINAALSFPAPAWLSVVYPATSSYAIMCSFAFVLKAESVHSAKSVIEHKIQLPLILLFVAMIVINRLLIFGFSFT